MRYRLFVLAILGACAAEVGNHAGDAAPPVDAASGSADAKPPDPRARPQYVVISPQWPDELLEAGVLDDMIAKLGTGGARRHLAWMLRILAFQDTDEAALRARLRAAFSLAEAKDLPLALHVDFEFWWENRPDLWNWWDPTMPGYDPANRYNVEWSDWDTPVKERVIDWGTPVVLKPPPCFGSQRVRDEARARGTVIAQEVLDWYQHLIAIGRPDLLVGINPTGETSVPPDVGYCALHFRGYGPSNPPADPEHELQAAARNYAAFENRVFGAAGFTIDLLSTHAPPWGGLLWTAITDEATPGFSLYSSEYVADVLALVGDQDWIVAEASWHVLPDYVDQPRLRWIALYNWAHGIAPGTPGFGDLPIAENPAAISSIRAIVAAEPP